VSNHTPDLSKMSVQELAYAIGSANYWGRDEKPFIAELERRTSYPAAEMARLRAVEESWEDMKSFLKHIAMTSDCGCRPCRGQCSSPAAMKFWIDEVISIAKHALANAAKVGGGA